MEYVEYAVITVYTRRSPVEVLLSVVLFLGICVVTLILIRSICQWIRNNRSPIMSVAATVEGKRVSKNPVTNRMANGHQYITFTTTHYVAFQTETGELMEFPVSGSEYECLTSGQFGILTYQGTRYHGFEWT